MDWRWLAILMSMLIQATEGCEQLSVEGYSYGQGDGLYNIIPDVQCEGYPAYRKDNPTRYLYRHGDYWRIGENFCYSGYIHIIGRSGLESPDLALSYLPPGENGIKCKACQEVKVNTPSGHEVMEGNYHPMRADLTCFDQPIYEIWKFSHRFYFYKWDDTTWYLNDQFCVGPGQVNFTATPAGPHDYQTTWRYGRNDETTCSGCGQLVVEGYSYNGYDGIYTALPHDECDGKPPYAKEDKHIYHQNGYWRMGSSNCREANHYHMIGTFKMASPEDAPTRSITCNDPDLSAWHP